MQKRNPGKLQKQLETAALLLGRNTALTINPVPQIRQPRIIKDDLIEKQFLGSFLAWEALTASPDAA